MSDIDEDCISFIKNDIIPEMVHNRCFCECGSREFVEYDSIVVEPLKTTGVKDYRELYRGQLVIKFSGESRIFFIIIKLLSHNALQNDEAYGRFVNEEMFYNKMIAEYNLDIYPKCYVADMGRYGRPVVVVEDLEAVGYSRPNVLLDEDHLKLCLEAIAKFHACGVKLKKNKFEKFREFYAKIIDTNSEENSDNLLSTNTRLECAYVNGVKNLNEVTICHGEFNNNHLAFQYEKSKPVKIKILGWNGIKHTLPIIDLKSILNNNVTNENSECKNEIESIEKIDCIQKFIEFYYGAYVNELTDGKKQLRIL